MSRVENRFCKKYFYQFARKYSATYKNNFKVISDIHRITITQQTDTARNNL